MRVVIAGSSGLIGTALVAALRAAGHQVFRLVRRDAAAADELSWNPRRGVLEVSALKGADAVVNLCGAGIDDRRWTGAYKQELRDSRIISTDVLSSAVALAGVPVLLNASAVGYYGDTGDRIITESAAAGTGFLAAMCRDWESATEHARTAGVRTVLLRSGVVLADAGGALARLRPLFSLGLGGRLGNGRQYLPWISLPDEVGAICFALDNTKLHGPLNLVGPAPVTNAQFTQALGHVLHRPTVLTVPSFALRFVTGEMADEALLTSQRVVPFALEESGYPFQHNTIGAALAAAVTT